MWSGVEIAFWIEIRGLVRCESLCISREWIALLLVVNVEWCEGRINRGRSDNNEVEAVVTLK